MSIKDHEHIVDFLGCEYPKGDLFGCFLCGYEYYVPCHHLLYKEDVIWLEDDA